MNDSESESGRPNQPSVVTSGPFVYDPRYGLRAGAHRVERASQRDLQLALRKNAASWRRPTIPFIKAQLHHYSIAFPAAAKKDGLMAILQRAVRSGKCKDVPVEVQAIEASLREKFAAETKEYEKSLRQWKRTKFDILTDPSDMANENFDWFIEKYFLDSNSQPDRTKCDETLVVKQHYLSYPDRDGPMLAGYAQKIPGLAYYASPGWIFVGWDSVDAAVGAHFDGIDSPATHLPEAEIPTAEAMFDFNRFLKKRLGVDINGTLVGGDKPREPVLLSWRVMHSEALNNFSRRTPSIIVRPFDYPHVTPGIIIGWDRKLLFAILEKKLESSHQQQAIEAAEKEAEVQKKEADFMRPHRLYTAQHKPRLGPLTSRHLVGSYIVRCSRFDENWHNYDRDGKVMNIFPTESKYGVIGSFDFGTLEGTILFGMSQQSVQSLYEEQPTKDPERETEANSDGSEHDVDPFPGSFSFGATSEVASQSHIVDFMSDPWGVKAAMARQQQAAAIKQENTESEKTPIKKEDVVREETATANRVYLRYASQYPESDSMPDSDENQSGYVDFDSSKLVARGIIRSNILSGDIDLTLYRVSDTPNPKAQPEPWYTFGIDRNRRFW